MANRTCSVEGCGGVASRKPGWCRAHYDRWRKKVDPANWHLDHVVPLSRGGEHSYANVQVAHPFCNLSKGPRLIEHQMALL
jgi:5-methylcytosine-specific restriction endonuclease McrA